jgi:hypothetical protein
MTAHNLNASAARAKVVRGCRELRDLAVGGLGHIVVSDTEAPSLFLNPV